MSQEKKELKHQPDCNYYKFPGCRGLGCHECNCDTYYASPIVEEKEGMIKRFRKEYATYYDGILNKEMLDEGNPWFESFVLSEIDKALAEQRERIVKEIEKIKLPSKVYRTDDNKNIRKMHVQMLKHEGHNKAITDIINIIKSDK